MRKKLDVCNNGLLFNIFYNVNSYTFEIVSLDQRFKDLGVRSLVERNVENIPEEAAHFIIHNIPFYFIADNQKREAKLIALKDIVLLTIKIDGNIHYQSEYKAKNPLLLSLGHHYSVKINKKSEFSFDCYYIS